MATYTQLTDDVAKRIVTHRHLNFSGLEYL